MYMYKPVVYNMHILHTCNTCTVLYIHVHVCTYIQIPGAADLYSYYVDFDTRRLENWEKTIPSFTYNPEVHTVCICVL